MTDAPARRHRLVVLASHPIQYRAPLYRHLAREPWLDLEVWYGDAYGVEPRDGGWGVENFVWDGDLLSGYRHRFLRNVSPRPHPSTALGKINPELPGALRRSRPDAVWISGYSGLHPLLSLLSARLWRIPILYSSDTNHLAEPSGLRRRIKRIVVPRIYRRIAAFLVSGRTNELHYEDYGVPRNRRFPVPWAVDNAGFEAAAEAARPRREELRLAWGVGPAMTVALFAGLLNPGKRPMDLVDVAERLPDVHVVIAGRGPLEEPLRAAAKTRAAGRVTFLGFQNQSALPAIYAASDVLVLPSESEAWGLVVNEALASGISVIASDRVGAAYDLVPERLRFPVGDVAGISRAVQEWRTTGDPREAIRERVSRFSFESDARGIHEALDAVASEAAGNGRSTR